jgi:hypothetical protein
MEGGLARPEQVVEGSRVIVFFPLCGEDVVRTQALPPFARKGDFSKVIDRPWCVEAPESLAGLGGVPFEPSHASAFHDDDGNDEATEDPARHSHRLASGKF